MKKQKIFLIRRLVAMLCLAISLLGFFSPWGQQFLKLQFIPSWLSGRWPVIALLVASVIICGRMFCSTLCPLGALQELIMLLTPARWRIPVKDWRLFRYFNAGISIVLLFSIGPTVYFRLSDPYSNFGRITRLFYNVSGAVFLFLLLLLTLRCKRFFCANLCPVGAMLGILSKVLNFRYLSFNSKCVKCRKCLKSCPVSALDDQGCDISRCIRCGQCQAVCPTGGISIAKVQVPFNSERRNFIKLSTACAVGMAGGIILDQSGLLKKINHLAVSAFLPPGAETDFAVRCTSCQLCVASCPSKILVPGGIIGIAPVKMNFRKGVSCLTNCSKCTQVCPAGALKPMTPEEKIQANRYLAKLNAKYCLVFQGEGSCGKCAAACPTQAITLRANGSPRPVQNNRCIGCGRCIEECPQNAFNMHIKPLVNREGKQ